MLNQPIDEVCLAEFLSQRHLSSFIWVNSTMRFLINAIAG